MRKLYDVLAGGVTVIHVTQVLTTILVALAIYRIWFHPLRAYPGPLVAKLTDGWSGFHAIKRNIHLVVRRKHRQYGSVIRLAPNRLVFNTVTAFREIYLSDRITKAHTYLLTIEDNTYNVFTAVDKDIHRPKRKLIGKAVMDRSIRLFEPTLLEQVDIYLRQLLRRSRVSEPVDMTLYSRCLSLDIVGKLAFGYDLELLTSEENRFIMNAIGFGHWRANVFYHVPWMAMIWPTKLLDYVFYEAREKYFRLIETMVQSRISKEKNAIHDLYSIVADDLPVDPENLRRGDLWAEAVFFLSAGGDTTATVLAAVLFYLTRNGECYENLAHEIRTTFKSGQDIKGGPQLASCAYLRACVDETLRMSPPVSTTLWRERDVRDASVEPLVVDGHVIPPGTMVGVNIYALHHNPEYFPDPYSFRPERWLATAEGTQSAEQVTTAKKLMHDAFGAFSIGSRGCAGRSMAYLEMSLVLAKTLWYFDFGPAPGKLGGIGGGSPQFGVGRDKPGEYQLYDIFTSRHEGPFLVFKPRGSLYADFEDSKAH